MDKPSFKGATLMETSTLPAIKIDQFRHPLMVEKTTSYVEHYQKEIEADAKLGLKKQPTTSDLLKADILELTSSNEYYQVTPDLLRRMFNFRKLRAMCMGVNTRSFFSAFWGEIKDPFKWVLLTGGLTGIFFMLFWCTAIVTPDHNPKGWAMLGAALGTIGSLMGMVFTIACVVEIFSGRTHRGLHVSWDILKVKLEMETIEDTSIKIPYAAKLKTIEAKEKGIFETFAIAFPKLEVERGEFRIEMPKLPRVDPVILGVARDKRMFLIAWWDIAHDIDKVQTNIEMFKKFKVS
jgi:hypothetical protein